jgi:hypothetical protein
LDVFGVIEHLLLSLDEVRGGCNQLVCTPGYLAIYSIADRDRVCVEVSIWGIGCRQGYDRGDWGDVIIPEIDYIPFSFQIKFLHHYLPWPILSLLWLYHIAKIVAMSCDLAL